MGGGLPIQNLCDPKHATKSAQHLMSHQPPPRIVGRGNYRAIPLRRASIRLLVSAAFVVHVEVEKLRLPAGQRKTRGRKASVQLRRCSRQFVLASDRAATLTVSATVARCRQDRCSGASQTVAAIRLALSAAWFHTGALPRERLDDDRNCRRGCTRARAIVCADPGPRSAEYGGGPHLAQDSTGGCLRLRRRLPRLSYRPAW
jgi:hypothetical protein